MNTYKKHTPITRPSRLSIYILLNVKKLIIYFGRVRYNRTTHNAMLRYYGVSRRTSNYH